MLLRKQVWALCMLCAVALVIGACSSDKKKSRGGGATSFAIMPEALPTLAGLTTVIDVSGGNATTGDGGRGGVIRLSSTTGDIVEDSGQSRPSVSNNALAGLLGTGNPITWADFEAGVTGLIIHNEEAVLILDGRGFYLPAGETLDFSDADEDIVSLELRLWGTSSRVRVDGDIMLTRPDTNGLTLVVRCEDTTGTAIVVDGVINANGADDEQPGYVSLYAPQGRIVVGGEIHARGGAGTSGSGFDGGEVTLIARDDVVLRRGTLVAHGGNGIAAGRHGGDVLASFAHCEWVWAVLANGGNGMNNNAGGGGYVQLTGTTLWFDAVMQLHGGSSLDDSGSWGGYVEARTAVTLGGGLVVEANGGDGDGTWHDGWGGYVSLQSSTIAGLWASVETNSGDNLNGGTVWAGGMDASAVIIANSQLDVVANGVDSDNARNNGGFAAVYAHDLALNLAINLVANGGNTLGVASGGSGGEAYLALGRTPGIEGLTSQVSVDIEAHGGDGLDGGHGGISYSEIAGPIARLDLDVRMRANGGDATGVSSMVGYGGQGGTVEVEDDWGNASVDLSVVLDVVLNGGSGFATANDPDIQSGRGGEVLINFSASRRGPFSSTPGTSGAVVHIHLTGQVTALGADCEGGEGGATGRVYADTGEGAGSINVQALSADLRAGHSHELGGGGVQRDGGEIRTDSFVLRSSGPLTVSNLSVNASGGHGLVGGGYSNIQPTGPGDGEYAVELSTRGSVISATNTQIIANGGDGTDRGGDGGAVVVFSAQNTEVGASVWFEGEIQANGGESDGTVNGSNVNGGHGGFIGIGSPPLHGQVTVEANLHANGGHGFDQGGDGGTVIVSGGTGTLSFTGSALVNGGDGRNTPGDGGFFASGGGVGTNIVIHATIEANGGEGLFGFGGDGGRVALAGEYFAEGETTQPEDSIRLRSGTVVRANGGTGGGTAGASSAGFIEIDVMGTGGIGANTNIIVESNVMLETLDGDGIDQSATNIITD